MNICHCRSGVCSNFHSSLCLLFGLHVWFMAEQKSELACCHQYRTVQQVWHPHLITAENIPHRVQNLKHIYFNNHFLFLFFLMTYDGGFFPQNGEIEWGVICFSEASMSWILVVKPVMRFGSIFIYAVHICWKRLRKHFQTGSCRSFILISYGLIIWSTIFNAVV